LRRIERVDQRFKFLRGVVEWGGHFRVFLPAWGFRPGSGFARTLHGNGVSVLGRFEAHWSALERRNHARKRRCDERSDRALEL
jgi:hypothetical protein